MQLPLLSKPKPLDTAGMQKALAYIDAYWPTLTRDYKNTRGTLIGLPHPYIVPSNGSDDFHFDEQYYWDSYITAVGLTDPKHQPIVEGMLENLLYLFRTYGLIPNASRMYMLSRSQPPILTSYIFLVYERYGKSAEWLEEHMAIAELEYMTVWMSTHHPLWHQVHKGLSRYYDINMLHDLAEAESGWDMTPRFQRKALDYLPIDLNCLLFKYETDFARVAQILGNFDEEKKWLISSETRRTNVNKLMWGKIRAFYFDYNYQKSELGNVWSLAAYYAMWSGLATEDQALKMTENLLRFSHRGGLSTTAALFMYPNLFGSTTTQWAHPNGWAPLHYIVTEGLERYGYSLEARDIAYKWMRTNLTQFQQQGLFLEKYNVVSPEKKPVEGVYPSQTGFAWTNAIFTYYAEKYID